MRKKLLVSLFTVLLALAALFAFAACDRGGEGENGGGQTPTEPIKYRVNFIVDNELFSYVETAGQERIVLPAAPQKEDAVFDGWYRDNNAWQIPFTADSLTNVVLTGEFSVYAKYTVVESGPKGTEIVLEGFKYAQDENLGKVYSIVLSNARIRYSLNEVVTVNETSRWTLSTDIYGNDVIASKTVVLDEGNNFFYIVVTAANGKVEQYTLLIRRRPMYTVTYMASLYSVYDTESVEEGSLAHTPERLPESVGRTFLMWTHDFTQPIMEDVTTLAVWTANKYTITYAANGGTLSPGRQEVTYGAEYTLQTPTRNGYTFDGWYHNGEKIESGESWKFASDVTLQAKWAPISYSVSYELDGGTNDDRNPSSYTIEQTFNLYEPQKRGHTFLGWTVDGSSSPVGEATIPLGSTGNKTFRARWQANQYQVTLNGTAKTITVTYGESYSLPVPERQGYNFVGWYLSNRRMDGSSWNVDRDVTLTDKWQARTDTPYTVEHYLQNLADDDYTLTDTDRLTGTTDGYAMSMVKTYEGFTSPSSQSATIVADGSTCVKYYYTRNSYTISFVTNGGNALQPIVQKYQSELTLPDAVRENYTFGGWFENADLSVANTYSTILAKDVTLYAWWTEETKALNFEYSGKEGVTISKYKGSEVSVAIPAYIGGIPVCTIGGSTFKDCSSITNITIPDTVTSILSSAFQNATHLTKIVIPDSVTRIGWAAFKGCSALADITLPFVGETATESSVHRQVFGYIFGSQYEGYGTYNDSQDQLMSSGYTSQGGYYSQSVGRMYYYYYKIPTSIRKVTITMQTQIPACAFRNCNLIEEITIPQSVTSIGGSAFANCAVLKRFNSTENGEFNIPTSVTTIEGSVFSGNKQATKVTLGQNITAIGASSFYGCISLIKFNSENDNELIIPNGVESVGSHAFQSATHITKIVVPDSVTRIGWSAFKGCSALADITLPFVGATATESSVHSQVFGHIFGSVTDGTCNNSKNQLMSSGNTSQGFTDGGNQYYYTIPTSIRKVTITKQTQIPACAFRNCDLIEEITIPQSVASIGGRAFSGCGRLTVIYYGGTETDWENITINTNNTYLTDTTRYYYSEEEPALTEDGTAYNGNYWHYNEHGEPVIWKKEN